MNNIKVIERILSNLTFKKDFFVVESYPNYPSNRIGIDGSGNIVILVKTINLSQSFFNDINTQNLSIYFDKRCSICINETRTIEFYSILLLKDHSLVYYFINLFEILVHKLGEKPELSEFKEEVDNLRMLFNKATVPGLKTILGLWGELFLIATCDNPVYAIHAWHKMPTDLTDFNDGELKVEVKTTTKSTRTHHFSLSQLSSIINPNTIIASILTSEIDDGLSICDLLDILNEKISSQDSYILLSKVMDVLGDKINFSSDFKFDSVTALSSKRLFRSVDIPCIKETNIPNRIRNVHFEVELDISKSIKKDIKSKFFKILNKHYV